MGESMTAPVQCFLLEVTQTKLKLFTVMLKAERTGLIDTTKICLATGQPHRLEIEMDYDEGLTSMTQKLPLKCNCGMEFTETESDCWTSEHSRKYTNPKTGKTDWSVTQVATPGAMWFCPWYVEDHDGIPRTHSGILSSFYLEQWLGKRPPISVRCPNGSDWIVDQKASNGAGWVVTGEAPNITCSPSIVAGNYHSFLINGVFGEDPNCPGVPQPT